MKGHQNPKIKKIRSLMNNNFRNMNASCCKDSLVKIWKAESGKLITNMNFQSRKAKNKILK